VRDVGTELGVRQERPRWPLSVDRFEESGYFTDVRELFLHSVEQGDGDRLIGFALSEGSTTTLLERGVSEADLGLDDLREVAGRLPGAVPWWLSYRLIVGRRAS
jgi:hypothetical protein